MHRPGLVDDFPGHDGRVVHVLGAGAAVGAPQHVADVGINLAFAGLAGVELRDVGLVLTPVVAGGFGQRLAGVAVPFQVLAQAAAPLPGIGEVQHGLHVALAQLGQQVVEPGHDAFVELARLRLQRLQHAVLVAVGQALSAHHHAQVGHALLFQKVELLAQALPAGVALGSQQPAVPVVGPNVAVGLVVEGELLTLHANKPRLLSKPGLGSQ